MRNVSSAFKQALKNDNRQYKEYVDFTLTDSTVLNLTNEHFWQGGFSWEDAVASSDFEVGSAIINKATLVLNNIYEDFDEYDFFGATATVGIGLEINGTVERINIGYYTVVNQPKYNGSLITIEMYDNMYKFDKPYADSTLIYPASLDTIVRDACTNCGVTLITTDFPNKSFTVLNKPDGSSLTYREVIAYSAQIAGCYARCNENGYLTLKWYDFDALEEAKTSDNVVGVHYIDSLYNNQFSVDDVVITGVRVSVDYEKEVTKTEGGNTYTETEFAKEEYLYGSDGYVVAVENNPLIDHTQVQAVATYLGTRINGVSFKTADVSHGSDPSIEAGDVAVYIDRKNKRYGALVSKTVFSSNDAQKTNSIAEEPVRNSAARFSAETKNYVEMRKLLAAEKTERERVEEDLAERISNAGGLYETQVQQTGGGVITYLHNKPLLAESDIQIQVSTVGVTVTANGTAQSPTWYGLTVDGQLIANILTTVGVNADWINTGQLVITKNGTEVFFADVDTGTVRIKGDTVSITAGDPISTAISAAEQSANSYTDQQVATAGGYTLETPFTWTNNNQTANFTAVVYKGTEDVTSTFDPNWFVWTLRTEDGETQVGTGKTLTLNRSQFGYGATVTCTFTTYDDVVALRAVDGKKLKSVDGKQLKMYANQDEDVLVSDLPIKAAAEIDSTDKLMGIDNVEGYQVSITNFGDFLATSKYDGRYYTQTVADGRFYTKTDADARFVNVDGDMMTGDLLVLKDEPAYVSVRNSALIGKIGTPPSETSAFGAFRIMESGGNSVGWVRVEKSTADSVNLRLTVRRYNASNSIIENTLNLGINSSGNRTVAVSAPAEWRAAIGAVNKAGDTMTGELIVKYDGGNIRLRHTGITVGTTPSSSVYGPGVSFQDTNGTPLATVGAQYITDGKLGAYLQASRTVNGTALYNKLSLMIDASGNRSVTVSDQAAWRSAIGAVNKAGDTLTGNLTIQRTSGDTYFTATRTDTGVSVLFGVGSGGTNHGVYSYKQNRWLLYGNDSNVYVAGMNFSNAASARASLAVNPKWVTATITVGTLAANGGEKYNQSTTYTLPSGYTACAITRFALSGSGYTRVNITQVEVSGNTIKWSVRNDSSTATGSLTLTVVVFCLANS